MVLLEMSITPLGEGVSVSRYVARCLDIVDASRLEYELHSMGTILEGELDEVLDVMKRCIQQLAEDCERISISAKLDYRKGHAGRLRSKVASVEKQLGRPLKK